MAWSNFSFLRAASHPEELVERAHALGMPAIGLADWGGLYGVVRAYVRARALGMRLVVGAELPLDWPASSPSAEPPSLVLLASTVVGYRHLCRAVTRAHADQAKGSALLPLAALTGGTEGLIAIAPVDGLFGPQGEPLLEALKAQWRESLYLGAWRWRDGRDEARERLLRHLGSLYDCSVVATARPRMHLAERKPLLDVVRAIALGSTLQEAKAQLAMNAEARILSENEILERFADHPDWVALAGQLASQVEFELSSIHYRFPCQLEPGESADEQLRRLSQQGACWRYPEGVPAAVQTQIERELGLIAQLGMASYFLSTAEIVTLARQRQILCQGRGSAANSAVCFVLGITAVDPARSHLLFERFMSPERQEPPDIDVDFEHERREEVISAIYEHYGRDQAAMVAAVIRYRGKSALLDVGKTLGFSQERLQRLSRAIGGWGQAADALPHLGELGFEADESGVKLLFSLAAQLEGFPRHLSIHVGGFVLSADPLELVAPVEPARKLGRTVLPWDKDDIEALGFFKVDVLALGALTALRKSLELIFREGGLRLSPSEQFDPIAVLARIPAEDPSVYRQLCRGDTVGIFQIESRAQMAMLSRLRPRCFYDLVIQVAIVRPGPIQGGMVHPYLRRRNGEQPVRYPHACLRKVLERTLGVPLFQEQVMQVAIEGAGYSGGEADQLRRDMAAWKRHGRLLQHRERLMTGFAQRGISKDFGEALFRQIQGFGEYGFPESHASSFALIVYAASWLKTHYPVHFLAGLLNAQPMGFYSVHSLVRNLQQGAGGPQSVRDVDVLRSDWDATLEWEPLESALAADLGQREERLLRPVLRLGLREVKGLSRKSALALVAAREQTQITFESLHQQAQLPRDEWESLARAGALESLMPGRRQALWAIRAPRVSGLFSGKIWESQLPSLPHMAGREMLREDYLNKGFSLSDHPLSHLRSRLAKRGVVTAAALKQLASGSAVAIAGMVLCRQQPQTASGVIFITIEDETGCANLIIFRQLQERQRLLIRQAGILLALGRVESSSPARGSEVSVIHVLVESLERLDRPSPLWTGMSRDFH